jgi:glucose/arabinose dehydrogenase
MIRTAFFLATTLFFTSCKPQQHAPITSEADTLQTSKGQRVDLAAPYATKSTERFCEVIGWPRDKTPIAPQGFSVTRFADSLDNPRWIYIGPNGDIFISEASTLTSGLKAFAGRVFVPKKVNSGNTSKSANNIILLRDANHDGIPELRTTFLSGLNQPFGMLVLGNNFYVANTDGVLVFPYQPGQTSISGKGKKILSLPAGGYNNHWTRNLLASKDGKKIYITVGSSSNVGEHGIDHEQRRANILEINPDGSGERVYAYGLRNPQGMGWAPGTNTLWTSVNERDELGDELVPDFLTSVKDGGFYGWPYAYWGQHPDPRVKEQRPDLVTQAIIPDVPLGAHTASLGLAFDEKQLMPGQYKGGAFIGQHGSWNRSSLSGYEIAFVPFSGGRPSGKPTHFLTGFIADSSASKVYGRPVGVAFTPTYLLVADDAGNTIWCVRPANQ